MNFLKDALVGSTAFRKKRHGVTRGNDSVVGLLSHLFPSGSCRKPDIRPQRERKGIVSNGVGTALRVLQTSHKILDRELSLLYSDVIAKHRQNSNVLTRKDVHE